MANLSCADKNLCYNATHTVIEMRKFMTDNPKPEHDPKETIGNSTNNLREAAEDALRRLREAQLTKKESVAADTSVKTDTQPDKPTDVGNTTHDLARAAYEAMHMAQQKAASDVDDSSTVPVDEPAPNEDKQSVFGKNLMLRLDSNESSEPLLVDVAGEMIVGRADNVTDYMPDIDLTPHGAYRLGLSRRHAILAREQNQLVVKDLKSRNGTFVNGKPVEKGGTQILRNGDELRFGNLNLRISYHSKD